MFKFCERPSPFWISLICSVAVSMAYFFPTTRLPCTESLDYSLIPMIDFWERVWQGSLPVWNFDVGLGSPWPPPHGIDFSPISPFLPFISPFVFIGLNVFIAAFVSSYSFCYLLSQFRIKRMVFILCVVTYTFSTTTEYLYWLDAIEVYISACMIPCILHGYLQILHARDSQSRWLGTLIFSISLTNGFINGHPGTISLYVILLLPFFLWYRGELLRVSRFFFLAGFLVLLSCGYKLCFMLNELSYFSSDVKRVQVGLNGWGHFVWGLIFRPLLIPSVEGSVWPESLASYVKINGNVRTLSFGLPFTIWAFISLRHYLRNPSLTPLQVVFLISILTIVIPIEWLPQVFSATYPARDVALIFGVILAGSAISSAKIESKFVQRMRDISCLGQIIFVVTTSFPLLWGFNSFPPRPHLPEIRDLVNAVNGQKTNFSSLIKKQIHSKNRNPLNKPRIAVSSRITSIGDTEGLSALGYWSNISMRTGLADVGFIGKSLSYDGLRQSQILPYGAVVGDRFQGFRVIANPNFSDDPERDWPIDDQAWLSVIGVEAVLSIRYERPAAEHLVDVGTLVRNEENSDYDIVLFKNQSFLPRAFWAPKELLNSIDIYRPGCDTTSFYCYDVSDVLEAAIPVEGDITTNETGEITINSLKDTEKSVTHDIIFTNYIRPEWSSMGDVTLKSWLGLMRFSLPAGVEQVKATYQVNHIKILRYFSYCFVISMYFSLFWLVFYKKATIT